LVIDLSAMKGIRVDPARRTVRAETGLKLGEFDRETQPFGLATTLGVVLTVGIAGLTLGGWGNLHAKYGLAIDNVIGADVVTADGELLTANATENPDLYWGVRGGSGNFGVVTTLEYRLHPVGPVFGGAVFHRRICRGTRRWTVAVSGAADQAAVYEVIPIRSLLDGRK
jgi:FAD/FMN-containing dehydrogenase